jgi:Effector Associated Constant Component 1
MPEVRLEARSDRFEEDDDRWRSQVLLLHRALEEAAGPLERRSEPVSGTKGALSDMVLHLTGPGIVAGVVTALAAWLKRDRGRSVHLTWTVDGRHGEFTVTGTTIDNDTLRSALEHGLHAAAGDSAADDEPGDRNGVLGG